MATMTLYYGSQTIDPVDYISVDNTTDTICGEKYTLSIGLGAYSSVYVEFLTSNSDEAVIYPNTETDITEETSFNIVINTYQSAVNSGIGNTYETTATLNVYDNDGGALLDTMYVSRLSYNGSDCKEITL